MTVREEMNRRLQDSWTMCQLGVQYCREDSESRQLVLDWLSRQNDPWSRIWVNVILGDDPGRLDTLLSLRDYPGDIGDWRPLITSSPFALLRTRGLRSVRRDDRHVPPAGEELGRLHGATGRRGRRPARRPPLH